MDGAGASKGAGAGTGVDVGAGAGEDTPVPLARRVLIESPLNPPRDMSARDRARQFQANLAYATMAQRDALMRAEAPFTSHLLYTIEFTDPSMKRVTHVDDDDARAALVGREFAIDAGATVEGMPPHGAKQCARMSLRRRCMQSGLVDSRATQSFCKTTG